MHRRYLHILKVRELKNCYAEWKKEWGDSIPVWKAPDKFQGKDPKYIEDFIKKHNDKLDKKELISGEVIKINIRK